MAETDNTQVQATQQVTAPEIDYGKIEAMINKGNQQKENAILNQEEKLNEELTESFDFDELEEKLQSQLEEELADMQFLAIEVEPVFKPFAPL